MVDSVQTSPNLQSVLGFAARFVPYFIGSLAIYLLLMPAYRVAIVGAANAIGGALSPPTRVEIAQGGAFVAHVQNPGEPERFLQSWAPFVSHLLFLTGALLPALVLATPLPFAARWRLLVWGLASMAVVDVAAMVGLVRFTRCLHETPGAFVCLWLLRLIYASGQLSAAAIWGLLTWRHWFGIRAA